MFHPLEGPYFFLITSWYLIVVGDVSIMSILRASDENLKAKYVLITKIFPRKLKTDTFFAETDVYKKLRYLFSNMQAFCHTVLIVLHICSYLLIDFLELNLMAEKL